MGRSPDDTHVEDGDTGTNERRLVCRPSLGTHQRLIVHHLHPSGFERGVGPDAARVPTLLQSDDPTCNHNVHISRACRGACDLYYSPDTGSQLLLCGEEITGDLGKDPVAELRDGEERNADVPQLHHPRDEGAHRAGVTWRTSSESCMDTTSKERLTPHLGRKDHNVFSGVDCHVATAE